jgi:hypothetical protein
VEHGLANVLNLVGDRAGKDWTAILGFNAHISASRPFIFALVSDAAGELFAWDVTDSTVLKQEPSTTSWIVVTPNAGSLVSDAHGDVFVLNSVDQNVYEDRETTEGSWVSIATQTSSLVSDARGDVFALNFNDHNVHEHVQGMARSWTTVGYDYDNLSSSRDGNVYAFRDNFPYSDSEWVHVPGGGDSWVQIRCVLEPLSGRYLTPAVLHHPHEERVTEAVVSPFLQETRPGLWSFEVKHRILPLYPR